VQIAHAISAVFVAISILASAPGADIAWNGSANNWNSASWNAGVTASSITGFERGDGRVGDKFVITGNQSIVTDNVDGEGGGIRPRQGVTYELNNSLLTVQAPATGIEALPSEIDRSTLTLNGGTLRRQGRTMDGAEALGG